VNSLPLITAKRTWFVPDLVVWGLPSLGDHDYLSLESTSSGSTVCFGSASLSEASQTVIFGQLRDHRGNLLPSALTSPRVLIRTHSEGSAFVVGKETSTGFKVARDPDSASAMVVDLLVVEFGD